MYLARYRLIAYILLTSHSLMSCYNYDIGEGQKQIQHIQEQGSAAIVPDIKGIEGQEEKKQLELLSSIIPTSSIAIPLEESQPTLVRKKPADSLAFQESSDKKGSRFFNRTPDNTKPQVQATDQQKAHDFFAPISERQKISIRQKTARLQRKKEQAISQAIEDDLYGEESLTSIFTTRGGIQVQFRSIVLHSQKII